MRKFLGTVFIVVIVVFFAGCFLTINNLMGEFHIREARLGTPSILFMELDGIIMDGEGFLDDLEKYAKEDDIKGVLIQINSPGGVVGPSQEIYSEIKRIREQLKKPVVVSCLGLAASGAYYAAVAADKIVTNPGCMMGSIGVIMEFANLEKLYEWAKVKRYVIKTGQYKDSGSEYREMRADEKMLFQEMANEVHMQFKNAVAEGRKLPIETVTKYADGRVFTGAAAVQMGFADQVGTLRDATRLIGQMAGLGDDPEIFTPPPERPEFLSEFFMQSKVRLSGQAEGSIETAIHNLVRPELVGRPLFLMPGVR
jgi:protease-4